MLIYLFSFTFGQLDFFVFNRFKPNVSPNFVRKPLNDKLIFKFNFPDLSFYFFILYNPVFPFFFFLFFFRGQGKVDKRENDPFFFFLLKDFLQNNYYYILGTSLNSINHDGNTRNKYRLKIRERKNLFLSRFFEMSTPLRV